MYASLTGARDRILGFSMGGDLGRPSCRPIFEDIPGLIRGIQAGDLVEPDRPPTRGPLRTQMEQALASAGFDEDSLREIATSGNPGAEGVATRATTGAVMSAAAPEQPCRGRSVARTRRATRVVDTRHGRTSKSRWTTTPASRRNSPSP